MMFINNKHLKLVSKILCFLLVFQFCFYNSAIVLGSTETKVSYTINGIPQVGETIDIIVNVSNVQNLYGGSIDFLYDTRLLEVLSIEKGNIFGSNTVLEPVKKIENQQSGIGQATLALMLKGNVSGVSSNGTLAVIKAKVLNEGNLYLKTTNSNSDLSLSGNTCRIKFSDKNGTMINYSEESKNVSLIDKPTTGYNTYQDYSSFINYVGNWSTVSHSLYNDGSIKLTNSPSSYLEFNFTGSSFKLFATKGRSRGIAKIDIDNGAIVSNIDLYNSSDIANQLVYKNENLSDGPHTVKVYFTGTRNPNASSTMIDIDNIEVLGYAINSPQTYNTYQDYSSFIEYVGDWSTTLHSLYNGGSIKTTNSSSSYLEFNFTGSSFKLFATKGRNRGIAKIDIDNGTIVSNIDLYNSTDKANQLVYENKSLSNGTHTVKIYFTGEKNSSSSNTMIDIDNIEILGHAIYPALSNTNTYQDSSSFIKYVGDWSTVSHSLYNGGSIKMTNTDSSYLEFNFTGSSFKLFATKGRNRGIAKIDIDNGAIVSNIDLYNSSDSANQLVYENNNLSNKNHTVKVYFTGTKNSNSTNYIIDIDKIEVIGSAIDPTVTYNTYQDSSSLIKYVGDWSVASHTLYNGGSIRLTSTASSYLEFNFTGSAFKLFATKGRNRGIAKIDIDNGAIVSEIDLYNSSDIANQLVYKNEDLSNGSHTVKVYFTGTKNSSSSNNIIDIDTIEVAGSLTTPKLNTTTYQDSSSFIKYFGNWSTTSHSLYNGGSIKTTNSPSSYLEFTFTGSSFKLFATKGRNRGIAKIDIDNGTIVSNIDLYNSTDKANQLVYENKSLSNGTHTVKIYFTGEKNSSSSSTMIDIDTIEILGYANLK